MEEVSPWCQCQILVEETAYTKEPEWLSHQSMGAEVNIKEPVHQCNEWMGIVDCYVFFQSHNYKSKIS